MPLSLPSPVVVFSHSRCTNQKNGKAKCKADLKISVYDTLLMTILHSGQNLRIPHWRTADAVPQKMKVLAKAEIKTTTS